MSIVRQRLNPSFLIGKEFAWHDDFDTPSHEAIKTFFDMNGVGKAPDGGRTAVNTTYCPQCNSSYIVYAGVNEYYNSLYKITLQGIVEVLDEQY